MAGEVTIGAAKMLVTADTTPAIASMNKLKAATAAQARTISGSLRSSGVLLSKAGIAAQSFGRSMTTYATLPIVGIGAAATSMAMDFNKSFTQIKTLAGDTGLSIDEMKEKVLALSGETAQAPVDLAQGLYFVASSGAEAADMFPILEASAQGAASGMGDVQTIASLLTSATNAYADSNLQAATAMDIFVATVRQGKAEPAELAATLGTVVPVAAQMSVGLEDVGAALATATNLGVPLTRAVTGLRYLLASLQKPTDTAKNVMEDYGLTSAELNRTLAEPQGLLKTMTLMADTFDLTTLKGRQAFQTVVGGARGAIVANTLVGGSAEKAAKNFDALTKAANGAGKGLDDVFRKVEQTPEFKFQQAMAQLKAAMIDLGNAVIPILVEDVIPALQKGIQWFQNLSDDTKASIVKWAGTVALIGPALIGVGLAFRTVAGIVKGAAWITGLTRSFSGLTTATNRSAGALGAWGSVAGQAATAVVALGAEAFVLKQKFNVTANQVEEDLVRMLKSGEISLDDLTQKQKEWLDSNSAWYHKMVGITGRGNEVFEDAARRFNQSVAQIVKTTLDSSDVRAEWYQWLTELTGVSNDQRRALGTLIDAFYDYGVELDDLTAKQVENLLAVGDVDGALQILRDRLREVTKELRSVQNAQSRHTEAEQDATEASQKAALSAKATAEAAREEKRDVDKLSTSLRNVPSQVNSRIDVNTEDARAEVEAFRQYMSQPINATVFLRAHIPGFGGGAAGGIVGAQAGGIARRPVLLVGEGRRQTFAGRGAEAIVPFDERGIGILSEAMSRAMQRGRGGRNITVNVAGKVERPEDIKRELVWLERSRGW